MAAFRTPVYQYLQAYRAQQKISVARSAARKTEKEIKSSDSPGQPEPQEKILNDR
jgi:hypothetical protein